MIRDVDTYFTKGCGRCARFETPDCSTRRWAGGLDALRRICLEADLVETAKWGHPCYMHADRNITIIGAFRGDFRLSFFNAALMQDPERILEKQGPNARHPDTIRFTGNAQVARARPVILSYLAEAMRYAEARLKPPAERAAVELPGELVQALDCDPALADAFRSLTPGRQRSYALNLASAKTSETRTARIVRFREKILSGKGATER